METHPPPQRKVIKNNKLILMTWNKGNARLKNRINDIRQIVSQHKPHVMAIQELNQIPEDDIDLLQVQNYTWELDDMIKNTGRARTAILINNDMKYVRRRDLEPNNESVVWITIYPRGTNSINIQSLYRQWQIVGKHSAVPNTKSIKKKKQI